MYFNQTADIFNIRQNESKVFAIVISKLSAPGVKSCYSRGQKEVVTTVSINQDKREASIKEVGYYHVILGEEGMSVEAGKMRGKVPFCFSSHRKMTDGLRGETSKVSS